MTYLQIVIYSGLGFLFGFYFGKKFGLLRLIIKLEKNFPEELEVLTRKMELYLKNE